MTDRLTDEDLAGIRDHAVQGTLFVALASELLTLRTRAAYILSHGSAWEQRVMRGELDAQIVSNVPPHD